MAQNKKEISLRLSEKSGTYKSEEKANAAALSKVFKSIRKQVLNSKSTNHLESQKDFEEYLSYLSEVEKEVDQWPEEDKSRRATSFHAELSIQNRKRDSSTENKISLRDDSQRTPPIIDL